MLKKKLSPPSTYDHHEPGFEKEEFFFEKKGGFPADRGCRKFVYDPCKRIPLKAKAPDFEKYADEDFTL